MILYALEMYRGGIDYMDPQIVTNAGTPAAAQAQAIAGVEPALAGAQASAGSPYGARSMITPDPEIGGHYSAPLPPDHPRPVGWGVIDKPVW